MLLKIEKSHGYDDNRSFLWRGISKNSSSIENGELFTILNTS